MPSWLVDTGLLYNILWCWNEWKGSASVKTSQIAGDIGIFVSTQNIGSFKNQPKEALGQVFVPLVSKHDKKSKNQVT